MTVALQAWVQGQHRPSRKACSMQMLYCIDCHQGCGLAECALAAKSHAPTETGRLRRLASCSCPRRASICSCSEAPSPLPVKSRPHCALKSSASDGATADRSATAVECAERGAVGRDAGGQTPDLTSPRPAPGTSSSTLASFSSHCWLLPLTHLPYSQCMLQPLGDRRVLLPVVRFSAAHQGCTPKFGVTSGCLDDNSRTCATTLNEHRQRSLPIRSIAEEKYCR